MVKIEISTDNAAFEDQGCELARIFRELANKLEQGEHPSKVRDINGNTVGSIQWED